MSNRLILGDCVTYMQSLKDKSIDCVFADPPYGNETGYDSYSDTRENLTSLINKFMPEALRISNMVVITPGNSNQYLYPPPSWTLAFVNMAGVGRSSWGFSCWQPILVYGKDPFLADGKGCHPDVMIMKNSGDVDKYNGHPCPKPNNVMRWIINRTTRVGDTVLDPFMGSGTTGVACIELGRNFAGCELSEKYYKIAEKRICQAQPSLFPSHVTNYETQKELL
jgi:site-specific DNA-methyltransferase (adenine-specific)